MKFCKAQILILMLAFASLQNIEAREIIDTDASCGLQFFNVNFPEDVREVVENDLKFLKNIKGESQSSPLFKEIFGGEKLDGVQFCSYLQSRIKQIMFGQCGDLSIMACNQNQNLIITPGYVHWLTHTPPTRWKSNAVERVSILIHEARHSDDVKWNHVRCPNPFLDQLSHEIRGIYQGLPLADKYACDSDDKGSYGAQVLWLKAIENSCISCSEEQRQDAKVLGEQLQLRILPVAKPE